MRSLRSGNTGRGEGDLHKIVIICGPTAVGKTRVGIDLAQEFNGEIVSADSQQVWRGFDIGTAKANLTERSEVPHHLVDIVEPTKHFDAARFVELADAAIADIQARGKRAFVVGGTGMFLRMLLNGVCDAPPQDADFRAELEREIAEQGLATLHARLAEIDPASAERIHPNDTTRIVRALEIQQLTGEPASTLRDEHRFAERRYDVQIFGLDLERTELYARIDARVDRMIEEGLVDEVRGLLEKYDESCQPFAAVGYREVVAHLRGELPLDETVERIKRNSRRFAKRQLTWFRADPAVRWSAPADALALLQEEGLLPDLSME